MEQEPIQKQTDERSGVKIAGLFLAFVPSALILFIIQLRVGDDRGFLGIAFVLSVICCFASSFMLFRRGTVWSIVFGVIFLLLNLLISVFLGCVSLIAF